MAEQQCFPDDPTGLAELYRQVNDGPGTSVVQPAVAAMHGFAPLLAESSNRINTALRGTGATWQGQAAQAAAGGLTRLARWADGGGLDARTGGGQVQAYADSFAELKARVAAPEPVPALTSWGSFADSFGTMSDHSRAIERNQQAAAAAYQALAVHEQRTDQAMTAFPEPAAVPSAAGGAAGPPGTPVGGPGGGPGGGAAGGSGSAVPGSPAGGAAGAPPGGGSDAASGAAPGGGSSAPASGGSSPPGGRSGGEAGDGSGGIPAGIEAAGVQSGGIGGPPSGPPAGRAGGSGGGPASSPTGGWAPLPRPDATSTAGRPTAAGGPGAVRPGSGPVGIGGPALEARGGLPRPIEQTAHRGAPSSSGRGPGGPGGMGPMMGGAPGGSDRQHRNQHFIPSDEPFVVRIDDVSPPVLGIDPGTDQADGP